MIGNWDNLTGDLTWKERGLVNHICESGLKETRALLKEGSSQTAGAILAFETIYDAQFSTIEQFVDQWKKLEEKAQSLRNQDIRSGYWKLRGQQLQFEFILERILAYRVMLGEVSSSISARAGIYVGEWYRRIYS